ncbi:MULTISPECIES: glutamate 5-kinase [unclassified Acinetobacter]|uniref:glutamate 5-kinase n=1 Tax=unclassified Acinetobacter TaxID=196816 RepID=UPI001C5507A8|nr:MULTISPECIES: glutamate 5-kinase [unclassified Acinetobacter]
MIKNKIQAKVAKAFNRKLADAVDSFSCEKLIYSGDFDFETQTYPIVGDESYTGRGVRGNYLRDMVKPIDYQTTDTKATVLQNELTGIPQIGDVWQFDDGGFEVKNISQDPTSSIWTCQLRKV